MVRDNLQEEATLMKTLVLALFLAAAALPGQQDPLEGLWQGYDGEWGHVSRQLVALAEAIPAATYTWRPGPGVRSTSEVFMHIAMANFYLLSVTGPKMPADMTSPDMENSGFNRRFWLLPNGYPQQYISPMRMSGNRGT